MCVKTVCSLNEKSNSNACNTIWVELARKKIKRWFYVRINIDTSIISIIKQYVENIQKSSPSTILCNVGIENRKWSIGYWCANLLSTFSQIYIFLSIFFVTIHDLFLLSCFAVIIFYHFPIHVLLEQQKYSSKDISSILKHIMSCVYWKTSLVQSVLTPLSMNKKDKIYGNLKKRKKWMRRGLEFFC